MGNKRHMHTAFKSDALAPARRLVLTGRAAFPPWAIIAGDDNQRVVKTATFFQRRHNAANAIIEALHDIAI